MLGCLVVFFVLLRYILGVVFYRLPPPVLMRALPPPPEVAEMMLWVAGRLLCCEILKLWVFAPSLFTAEDTTFLDCAPN